jgi:GNAT superfamily N-acetyltransferase
MIPVAKLVQMEAVDLYAIPKTDDWPESRKGNRLEFIAHQMFPAEQWCELIERTYVETRDVPELNGLRRMASTLEGYASSTQGVPDAWWVVQCNGLDIGCLLLTRTANECCELTYCGLVPEWRGKGLSKSIMNYVREWALDNWIQGITLAVDLRNLPAIRLYQSCGFATQGFVQAWILPRVHGV